MTTTPAPDVDDAPRYTFDNSHDQEGKRLLSLLSAILDEHHSIDVLTRVGVTRGWRCLDLGPGAGTITHWLAKKVGPSGHVTALDLDPRHVKPAPNVTVVAGDVRTLGLEQAHYDVVHARLVLLHIPEREKVLDRLISALKPGGVLVVSDWDATHDDMLLEAPTETAREAFTAYQNALRATLRANGADLGWAWRAPLAMRSAQLVDVTAEEHTRLWAGGEPGCLLHESNSRQLEGALLTHGVTAEQLRVLREAMHDPKTLAYCYRMYTTVGYQPKGYRPQA
ncbi:class I SAM-dependent methyltransferase [Micromonospora sp. CPCC 206061]|uniref:class I SAM-dependent methyltransferase n=1 Tax=Micromonospora sp. CPCC 206061 TaxID=3122410 RepID=UPI002FF14A30